MTAGYACDEVFSELKTSLTAIKANYIDNPDPVSTALDSFRAECGDCTVESIRKYAESLKQNGQLTEDFKSTYIRWLYEEGYYQELLQLDETFTCVDHKLYTTLVKYKNNDINARTLINELGQFKTKQSAAEFPRTLFYTATTLNEIERNLVFAYVRNWNFLQFLITTVSFLQRNRSDVKKKLVSCVYRMLPNIR